MPNSKRNSSDTNIHRSRLIVVLIFIGLFCACIIGKLFMLQVVHGNDFAKRADRQYAPSSTQAFDRGTIYATTKDGTHVELATVTAGFKLAPVDMNLFPAGFNNLNPAFLPLSVEAA